MLSDAAKQLVEEHPGKLNVISVERDEPVDAELPKKFILVYP